MQGVGFRPFVVRLAKQNLQNGWIANTTDGVSITIEGLADNQQQFLHDLNNRLPPFAEIQSLTITQEPLAGYNDFQIRSSLVDSKRSAFVLPDIATCQECITDIFSPDSRFYRYPFTSCSYCGPRYSILYNQPYDRNRTSMAAFTTCSKCDHDYHSMDNRRFHAQTIACPACGPQLLLLDEAGKTLEEKDTALRVAAQQLHKGKIVAIKGIGGFQLLVDAANQAAIERLRRLKHRPQKPFAIMAPDLTSAKKLCLINELEQNALLSPAAPIVLLKRHVAQDSISISKAVAPDTHLLGIMLPYSPLHRLLLHEFGAPLVATSGNRQNEPICIDDKQALHRLRDIADFFLTHNRSIMRPLDDSIVRSINRKMTVLRRARGYSTLPVQLNSPLPDAMAVGGQLKSTLAICQDNHAILSQHLGDLDSEASQQQFQTTLKDLQQLYQIEAKHIMHDLHKGYVSSQFAFNLPGNKQPVQHHYAHALSCMAEHGLEPPVLGIVWDGSGLGDDNTLWGGEFLLITEQGYKRIAHLRPFSLPGGIKAIQEPRRAALGLLYEIYAEKAFDQFKLQFNPKELTLLKPALIKQLNCARTSSAGRLFDAAASLLGLCQVNQYEGQAAMMLENSASAIATDQVFPYRLIEGKTVVIDWQLTFEHLLEDINQSNSALIAAKLHNTFAEMMLSVAILAEQKTIVLSGGCFQNAVLVEKAVGKLTMADFTVYCHEKIPPNDGGLALGQLVAANYLGL